jgi:hypothetical protein
MADREHLALIKQEIEAGNSRRAKNLALVSNLSEADLPGTDLLGYNSHKLDSTDSVGLNPNYHKITYALYCSSP